MENPVFTDGVPLPMVVGREFHGRYIDNRVGYDFIRSFPLAERPASNPFTCFCTALPWYKVVLVQQSAGMGYEETDAKCGNE